MLKIVFGFAPWIVYFVLLGTTRKAHLVAIVAALVMTLWFDRVSLKKGFILSVGSAIFFLILLIVTLVTDNPWVDQHASLLANVTLACIAFGSLVCRRPFTAQYAREMVPKEIWHQPGFMRVNQIITLVWGLSFLMGVMGNALPLFGIVVPRVIYWMIAYGPGLFAIWFSGFFPKWYRKRFLRR